VHLLVVVGMLRCTGEREEVRRVHVDERPGAARVEEHALLLLLFRLRVVEAHLDALHERVPAEVLVDLGSLLVRRLLPLPALRLPLQAHAGPVVVVVVLDLPSRFFQQLPERVLVEQVRAALLDVFALVDVDLRRFLFLLLKTPAARDRGAREKEEAVVGPACRAVGLGDAGLRGRRDGDDATLRDRHPLPPVAPFDPLPLTLVRERVLQPLEVVLRRAPRHGTLLRLDGAPSL